MKRALFVVLALSLLAAACSDTGDSLVGIRASSDPAVGDERLMFSVSEIGGTRRGSPDEIVTIVASPLDDESRSIEAEAVFSWIVPNATGLYIANVAFDTPGIWQISFSISTGEKTAPFLIDIQAEPLAIAIGEKAPIVATPTLEDTPMEEMTTDPNPLLSMYELSLDDALVNGRKTVVVFATPAFCSSATCGPLLNQVKEMVDLAPTVDFIHAEVYQGYNDAGFDASGDYLAPSVVEFGLPSEPWVFVMDEEGTVIARFDGVLGVGELEGALGIPVQGS